MTKLIVFNRREKACWYGRMVVDANTDVIFYETNLRLEYPDGSIEILAVIERPGDCCRYQGIRLDEIEYRSPVDSECADRLSVFIRRAA